MIYSRFGLPIKIKVLNFKTGKALIEFLDNGQRKEADIIELKASDGIKELQEKAEIVIK